MLRGMFLTVSMAVRPCWTEAIEAPHFIIM